VAKTRPQTNLGDCQSKGKARHDANTQEKKEDRKEKLMKVFRKRAEIGSKDRGSNTQPRAGRQGKSSVAGEENRRQVEKKKKKRGG